MALIRRRAHDSMDALEAQLRPLNLHSSAPNSHCGFYRDFAIAVTQKESAPQKLDHGEVVTPPSVLTLQIKYPVCPNISAAVSAGPWGRPLDSLVANRDARIAVDDRRTVLWLYNAEKALSDANLPEVIDRIIDRLLELRIAPGGTRCHECLKSPVNEPCLVDGRLAQICLDCLGRRRVARNQQTLLTSLGMGVSFSSLFLAP